MKKIKITALTENGERALNIHISESRKIRFLKKALQKKTGVNQEITNAKPLTVMLWATPNTPFSLTKTSHIIETIHDAMKDNGADITDYEIQEVE